MTAPDGLERLARYVEHVEESSPERELTAFWQQPTPEHARDYLRTLLPVLRGHTRAERVRSAYGVGAAPLEARAKPDQVGPYWLDEVLGSGAEGMVFRAHLSDGAFGVEQVALKLNARGDAIVGESLGAEGAAWPWMLLETYAAGMVSLRGGGAIPWIARELADETLHDFMLRSAAPLNTDQVFEIFSVACRGVASLHERHVYGWSAHSRNVYRVGQDWKLGDFGRVWCFVDDDHPGLEDRRQQLYAVLGSSDADARETVDWVIAEYGFGQWTGSGLLPYDAEREYRLRLDDCAMLGGLLVEMLTGKRWQWFFRSLNKRPYCSARYALTGDRQVDHALSQIVNRCWRGDAGGAPFLANAGRGELSVYDDPLELLEDSSSVLGGGDNDTTPPRL